MIILRYQKSKWKQAYLFKKNSVTKSAVPETALYSRSSLLNFLQKYPFVYLKPNSGGQGRGVIRVTRTNDDKFVVRLEGKSTVFNSEKDVQQALKNMIKSRKYVIQQGIRSVTAAERPFDIRVHVQRLHGKWIVGGMVGKVGNHGEIVTNRHRGGKPVSIEKLLRNHLLLDQESIQTLKRKLETLSIETAMAMSKGYPTTQEYGIDIGMDEKGDLWIYEANITPGIKIFKDLKNQSSYLRILRNRARRKSTA